MVDAQFITYETVDEGRIARIMLNRPEARNAQNRGLLVELNDAFMRAEADDAVRVVILGGVGKMFSSGHDMGSDVQRREFLPGPEQHPTRQVNGGTRQAAEAGSGRSQSPVGQGARPASQGRPLRSLAGTGLGRASRQQS